MITTKNGVLAALVFLLASIGQLPAKPDRDGPDRPDQVNLDIPVDDLDEQEEGKRHARAAQAIFDPHSFHEFILKIWPGREAEETVAAIAILYPDVFRRNHPRSPDFVRAEGIASAAILNPFRAEGP